MGETYIGEWLLPDWYWLLVVFVWLPFTVLGVYDCLFKIHFIRRYFLERRVIKEIRTGKWENKKRRASDRWKTFLANDVRNYEE